MLYEALAGRRPAEGEHMWAVAVAVREGTVTPISELRPDTGAELEEVVATAMRADPNDRFPSARRMAEALRQAAQSTMPLPVPADQAATTAVVRPSDGTQRFPRATSGAAGDLPRPPQTKPAPEEKRRRVLTERATARRLLVTAILGLLVSAILVAAVSLVPSDVQPRQEATAAPGPTSELPAPLSEALDRLEEAIP
jgi:hypothetical protein